MNHYQLMIFYCIGAVIMALITFRHANRVTASDMITIAIVSVMAGIVWPVAILLKIIDMIMGLTKTRG